MVDYGFIIPTCIKKKQHLLTLIKCIDSLQKFHSNEKIVIIIDHASTIKNIESYINYQNIIFENDPNLKSPADMLFFYYFLKNKYFNTAIIIQDSMFVQSKFNENDIEKIKNIKYMWHFTNHRKQWVKIKEPTSEYNTNNNIITHDDLINHYIDKYKNIFCDSYNYIKKTYNDKNKWSGSLGCCCIINIDFLKKVQNDTRIIDVMLQMKNNRDRRTMESIFPICCQYSCGHEIHSSFDGLYFDGVTTNKYNGINSGFNNIKWCCKTKHIGKISLNR